MELRTTELSARTNPIPERRRAELNRRQSIAWEDLESPSEILRRIAEQFQLTIRHPDLVPHDLWGGCQAPSVTAAEALSLVLIQFDLTFAWIDGGQGIDLVPIPDQVVVERKPKVKGRSPGDTLKLITDEFPNLQARLEGSDVVLRATLEEHEAVNALLSPSTTKKPTEKAAAPLRQRTFTLKFQRVPIRAIMKKLEESSVVFAYDAAALKAADINLDQTIDLQLDKASADEFCRAVFSPAKLSYEIDNLTIKLTPAR